MNSSQKSVAQPTRPRLAIGFTLIELAVVILILGILVTLATVSLTSSQYKSRNVERESDMSTLARGLEQRYDLGNPNVALPDYVQKGAYPGTNEMQHILGTAVAGFNPGQIANGYVDQVFPGVSVRDLTAPERDDDFNGFNIVCISACGSAKTEVEMEAIATDPFKYYYQPIDASGDICMQGDCVRFQLFWREEAKENVAGELRVIESRHQ